MLNVIFCSIFLSQHEDKTSSANVIKDSSQCWIAKTNFLEGVIQRIKSGTKEKPVRLHASYFLF